MPKYTEDCYPEVLWKKKPDIDIESVLKQAPLLELYVGEAQLIADHYGTDLLTVTQMFGHVMNELYPPEPAPLPREKLDFDPT